MYLRPRNMAREVRVPCSASNFSSKGVTASMFKNACKNPACTIGYVFIRYTMQIKSLVIRSGIGVVL